MLDSWLPFLMYGTLAVAIPASMILMSFVFATRPARRTKTRRLPFESGVSQGPPPAAKPVMATVTLAPPSPVKSVLASMTLEEKLQLLHSLRRGEPVALPVVERVPPTA